MSKTKGGRMLTGRYLKVSLIVLMVLLVTLTEYGTANSTLNTTGQINEWSDRYNVGIEVLRQVGGENYDGPINRLSDIAPDLARFTVEFAYGDVMSRDALDLQTRQLSTVAALTALGNAQPQLKYHINGCLNVGCSPPQVIESILLSTVYAGFPAALNGVFSAREVFQERGVAFTPSSSPTGNDRYERGLQTLEQVSAGSGADVVQSLQDIAPDLARFIIEFSYGDIIARPDLDLRSKELATVALLTALGTAQPQLNVHINASLNVGASREEIVEVIQQMAVYAGFPAALNGITTAREVFANVG
ncbi:carboxymuconolactone decarboxylase family protein [Leptothoe sp. ISB3NOV94-8A]|nr:carboxymuconolactone decarboxylase family protein [Adonisia turfae]MDV3351974.1 carboxymuconolactone decarboxylase family protein [Leptothoe sp. LEGE 181152]